MSVNVVSPPTVSTNIPPYRRLSSPMMSFPFAPMMSGNSYHLADNIDLRCNSTDDVGSRNMTTDVASRKTPSPQARRGGGGGAEVSIGVVETSPSPPRATPNPTRWMGKAPH
eukprot:Gb_24169 [translate_table: standard]